jgi:very-short-patch-repair endonuclease
VGDSFIGLLLTLTPEKFEEQPQTLWRHEHAKFVLIQPQVQLPFGRVDFVIYAQDGGEWPKLIVECEGHAFHERTPEQAAKDRMRDRKAVLAGYDVLRLTGSGLWNDTWGCAAAVHDWVDKPFQDEMARIKVRSGATCFPGFIKYRGPRIRSKMSHVEPFLTTTDNG